MKNLLTVFMLCVTAVLIMACPANSTIISNLIGDKDYISYTPEDNLTDSELRAYSAGLFNTYDFVFQYNINNIDISRASIEIGLMFTASQWLGNLNAYSEGIILSTEIPNYPFGSYEVWNISLSSFLSNQDIYNSILSGTFTVQLRSSAPSFILDYMELTLNTPEPIPEPTTMLLIGTGIAFLAISRLRRKKAIKQQ
ncbi:PEP-CTERM sorting domain-containing protein [Desulfobulbus propionicus]